MQCSSTGWENQLKFLIHFSIRWSKNIIFCFCENSDNYKGKTHFFRFCKLYVHLLFSQQSAGGGERHAMLEHNNKKSKEGKKHRKTTTLLFPHMPETNRPEKMGNLFFSRQNMREKARNGGLIRGSAGGGRETMGKRKRGKVRNHCVRSS